MKHLLLTTIAAVVLVGWGEAQQSAPAPEVKPETSTTKAPDISIHQAAEDGNIETVKQHLAAGADVNAKDVDGETPLDWAEDVDEDDSPEVEAARKEIAALPRKHGAKRGRR